MGMDTLKRRFILPIPDFAAAECRGNAALSTDHPGPPSDGLYLKGFSGTRANPRFPQPNFQIHL